MRTVARKTASGFSLTGSKMWISNAPIADLFVIWAKSEAHNGKIKGFLVEKGTVGLNADVIKGKLSLRASTTGSISLNDV